MQRKREKTESTRARTRKRINKSLIRAVHASYPECSQGTYGCVWHDTSTCVMTHTTVTSLNRKCVARERVCERTAKVPIRWGFFSSQSALHELTKYVYIYITYIYIYVGLAQSALHELNDCNGQRETETNAEKERAHVRVRARERERELVRQSHRRAGVKTC